MEFDWKTFSCTKRAWFDWKAKCKSHRRAMHLIHSRIPNVSRRCICSWAFARQWYLLISFHLFVWIYNCYISIKNFFLRKFFLQIFWVKIYYPVTDCPLKIKFFLLRGVEEMGWRSQKLSTPPPVFYILGIKFQNLWQDNR